MSIIIPVAIVAGFALVAAAIAVQPLLAEPQAASIEGLKQEIALLKKRVTRIDENAAARVRPAS
jgi:hypothetical protein